MNRGCDSSANGGEGDSSSQAEYLKHLNKISHKITKSVRKPPVYENRSVQSSQFDFRAQQSQPALASGHCLQEQQPPPPLQQQPPVYNINKCDFRDVVQKLTGSPAHERVSAPPPIQQTKQQSSRLQRIRPPPLAQICNRPASVIPTNQGPGPTCGGFVGGQTQPLSPLPPFPAVHAAAESPISAYMRFLQNSSFTGAAVDSNSKRFSSAPPQLASQKWNSYSLAPPPHHPIFPQHNQNNPPPSSSAAVLSPYPHMPSSPLPFSCLPSPRSPCALLSPNLLLSPTGQLGFPQLPLSPTVPVPSPTWNGI